MTITHSQFLDYTDATYGNRASRQPPRVWHAVDPPFRGYQALPPEDYRGSTPDTAIVIDNGMYKYLTSLILDWLNFTRGSSLVRAGWSFDPTPRLSFPADVSRYRDRKFNKTVTYVGYNAYADATTRGQIRNAFEPGTSIVSNWDVMEGILDHIFVNLGVDGNEGIERPVVMTEAVANLTYSRKSTYLPKP